MKKNMLTRWREGSKMGDVINGWSLMLDLSDDSNSFFFSFQIPLAKFQFLPTVKTILLYVRYESELT